MATTTTTSVTAGTETALHRLQALGQSIWLDSISPAT